MVKSRLLGKYCRINADVSMIADLVGSPLQPELLLRKLSGCIGYRQHMNGFSLDCLAMRLFGAIAVHPTVTNQLSADS